MADEKRYDVFISFHGSEPYDGGTLRESVVTPLHSKLKTFLSVFMDSSTIQQGDNPQLLPSIKNGILNTRGGGVAVVLASGGYMDRAWTQIELACLFAVRHQVRFLVFCVGTRSSAVTKHAFAAKFCAASQWDALSQTALVVVPEEVFKNSKQLVEYLRLKILEKVGFTSGSDDAVVGESRSMSYSVMKVKVGTVLDGTPAAADLSALLQVQNPNNNVNTVTVLGMAPNLTESNIDVLEWALHNLPKQGDAVRHAIAIVNRYRYKWLDVWMSSPEPNLEAIANAVVAWRATLEQQTTTEPDPKRSRVAETGGASVQPSTQRAAVGDVPQPIAGAFPNEKYRWVVVTGTGSRDLTAPEEAASTAVGRALARHGFGLVVGGYRGVDETVVTAFVSQLRLYDRAEEEIHQRLIYYRLYGDMFQPEVGRVFVTGRENEFDAGVDMAEAIVLIGGAGGTFRMFEVAMKKRRLVLPLAATNGAAHSAYLEIQSQLNALPARLATGAKISFSQLGDSDIKIVIDALLTFLYPLPVAERNLSSSL